jgi:hypothetical protein
MRNGKGSSNFTRHIDIRYFWITSLIKGRIVIRNLDSTDMTSDTLTKPLLQGGEAFTRHDEVMTNKE